LEADTPGVRYLAMRDLLDYEVPESELRKARKIAYREGPIGQILADMNSAGFWAVPGPGYNPKYHSTVWCLILLTVLGAARTGRGCCQLK
jgi:hypothetical protein